MLKQFVTILIVIFNFTSATVAKGIMFRHENWEKNERVYCSNNTYHINRTAEDRGEKEKPVFATSKK